MGVFEQIPPERRRRIVEAWKQMSYEDKAHFRNQIAIALALLGNNERAKRIIASVIDMMIDHTNNLSDFGYWFNKYISKVSRKPRNATKTGLALEGYRMKYALSE
ncbi:MAG: hypothetical protein GXN92_03710 [Candidatus Micrarchaeota archaeon]|nr:hypothetical protein [Candidatus Micrarchaeota archaeon]